MCCCILYRYCSTCRSCQIFTDDVSIACIEWCTFSPLRTDIFPRSAPTTSFFACYLGHSQLVDVGGTPGRGIICPADLVQLKVQREQVHRMEMPHQSESWPNCTQQSLASYTRKNCQSHISNVHAAKRTVWQHQQRHTVRTPTDGIGRYGYNIRIVL